MNLIQVRGGYPQPAGRDVSSFTMISFLSRCPEVGGSLWCGFRLIPWPIVAAIGFFLLRSSVSSNTATSFATVVLGLDGHHRSPLHTTVMNSVREDQLGALLAS